jgi:glyoxylase-like metal-dependent hydrolase (beta-lactamase superfamily II)
VIDPGDEAPRLIAALERRAETPRYILFTHGHYDHAAALPELLSYYSAREVHPEIWIHECDAHFLGTHALQSHRACFAAAAGGDTSFVDARWRDLPHPTRLIRDGDAAAQLAVLHLPGHSAGSVGFYDKDEYVLFSGDTLFCAGVGRTDLPGSDARALQKSLERLALLPPETVVYPGHGEPTTIGQEYES